MIINHSPLFFYRNLNKTVAQRHLAPGGQTCYNCSSLKYHQGKAIMMNNDKTWWQRLFLGLGILAASTATLSGSEASAPARYDTAMVGLVTLSFIHKAESAIVIHQPFLAGQN